MPERTDEKGLLATAARLAARCREDYVQVSTESGGVWTFCATCPRRGGVSDE